MLDMNNQDTAQLEAYMMDIGQRARAASFDIAKASTAQKNQALAAIANALDGNREALLSANTQDMAAGSKKGLDAALLDRLALTPARIDGMIEGDNAGGGIACVQKLVAGGGISCVQKLVAGKGVNASAALVPQLDGVVR